MEAREVLSVDEIELSDPMFWARPLAEREGAFLTLRRERPLSFQSEREIPPEIDYPQGPGFWAVTKHADVQHVSRHPEIFCSGQGSNIGDLPVPFREFFGSMINMDDPRHGRLRRIVSRGFTRRMLERADRAPRKSIAAAAVAWSGTRIRRAGRGEAAGRRTGG